MRREQTIMTAFRTFGVAAIVVAANAGNTNDDAA